MEHAIRKPDIPDMAKKEPAKIVLTPPIKKERDFRRFTRKNGVLIKDFVNFFDVEDGVDGTGRIRYKSTKTVEEATKFIRELCESAGRTVVNDELTGRLKAVPGWDLDIRVPGMESVEQNAAVEPDSAVRERQTNRMVDMLMEKVESLTAKFEQLIQSKQGKAKKGE